VDIDSNETLRSNAVSHLIAQNTRQKTVPSEET